VSSLSKVKEAHNLSNSVVDNVSNDRINYFNLPEYYALSGTNFSKCFLAAAIFSCVNVVGTSLFVDTIIMYVLPVNTSIYEVNEELVTSIPWNCD
jgi:hypothetical protein